MSDGNMSTVGHTPSIAPVATEEDMTKLSHLFSRAADAIVAASTLPAQIAKLSAEVESYKTQVESMQAHSSAQDTTINELRQARDNALSQGSIYLAELVTVKAENEGLHSARNSQELTIAQLNDELEHTRKARDDYGMQMLALQDDLKAVRDKLAKVKDRFAELLSDPEPAQPEPAKPIPQPEMPAVIPLSDPVDEAADHSEAPAKPWWDQDSFKSNG